MSEDDGKPTAFVIMPFDAHARPVYNQFIRPTLEDAGFRVFRSDDLLHQQNILSDILTSIESADLIIADLTDSNPNVYYELGLAHAFRKPVILLGQDMEEIPFDIRSYRLILYDTHFSRIQAARHDLLACAHGFLAGDLVFRNPVADFLGREVEDAARPVAPKPGNRRSGSGADDRGFIDHVEDLEGSYEALKEILQELAERTNRIRGNTNRTTDQIREGAAQGGTAGRNRVRKVARSLANELDAYREFLEAANTQYETAASKTENSLEFVLEFVGQAAEQDPEGTKVRLDSELETLREVLEATKGGREAFQSLHSAMTDLPPLERHLSRATAATAQEVRRLADNAGQTEAALSRGIEVGERIRAELDED